MKRIKIGVIPAAGRGKRISELPLTRILPKPMLPILNKPILEYVRLCKNSFFFHPSISWFYFSYWFVSSNMWDLQSYYAAAV